MNDLPHSSDITTILKWGQYYKDLYRLKKPDLGPEVDFMFCVRSDIFDDGVDWIIELALIGLKK